MTQPIVILLSTYNGQLYLEAQINSLYAQTHQNFSLIVRDDGSTDQTRAILKKYAQRYSNIILIEGDNLGVINSFYHLLAHCPANPKQFYAFCDQDDVWQPAKLTNALHRLNATVNPALALVCSRLAYVDSELNLLQLSPIPMFFGFENALIENSAIGCTMVFGEVIRQKILAANPDQMMMHDWWAYLVAAAFGEVLYDPEPSILYRQHANNVVGWDKQCSTLLKKSTKFLRNILVEQQGLQSLTQAAYFLKTYPDLSEAKQQLLGELLELKTSSTILDRYRFLQRTNIQRNNAIENLILRLTVLFNLH
ncbi:MAG: glycosyltransferase family 2 protein [Methylococcaceae bacterium]|nr:glycosyltransferase family 2 protein [Methylococcaceae bacterium]